MSNMGNFVLHMVHAAFGFLAIALSFVAIFTPGWSTNNIDVISMNQAGFDRAVYGTIGLGILPFTCSLPGDGQYNKIFNWNNCAEWFNNLPWTGKLVLGCMCIGLVFQLISFVWNVFSMCPCCCKEHFLHVLPVHSIVSVVFLAVSLAFWGFSFGQFLGVREPVTGVTSLSVDAYLGYSFWLALGALVLHIINTIIASVIIGRTKKQIYATQIIIHPVISSAPSTEHCNVEQGTDM